MHRTQPGRAALLGILWATACTGADSNLATATDAVDDSDITDTSDVPADTGELAGDTGGPVADPLGCTAADWLDPWAPRYRICSAGFVQLDHARTRGDDPPESVRVFGQFARTYKESQVVWDDVTLHAGAGLDDCTAIDHGNSGKGDSEQVVWFDVGEVVVAWDDPDAGSVVLTGSAPDVVSYSGSFPAERWELPRELRVQLTPGGPLGIPPSVRIISAEVSGRTRPTRRRQGRRRVLGQTRA